MALWHWILGGAAGYLLYKTVGTATAAPAGQASVTPEQQVATATQSAEIINYMAKAMQVSANSYSVTLVSGGYAVTDQSGTAITPSYPTLPQLLAQVKAQYPMAGW